MRKVLIIDTIFQFLILNLSLQRFKHWPCFLFQALIEKLIANNQRINAILFKSINKQNVCVFIFSNFALFLIRQKSTLNVHLILIVGSIL